jgi:hypothetical protein
MLRGSLAATNQLKVASPRMYEYSDSKTVSCPSRVRSVIVYIWDEIKSLVAVQMGMPWMAHSMHDGLRYIPDVTFVTGNILKHRQ